MNLLRLHSMYLLFFSFVGFLTCHILISIGLNPILASSLVGFTGSLSKYISKKASTIIYCSSFAAIGVLEVNQRISLLLLVPIFVWIIFRFLDNHFHGHGGKLGTIAFLSVSFLFCLVSYL